MRLITLGLGAALGYLLGSAEGRKNLEKMTQNAQKLWNDPKTQEKVGHVQETAQQKFAEVKKSDPVQKATAKVEDAMQGNDKNNDVRDDRGDVPGWVMITLMSAVLVAGLLALALPALQGLFNQAISQVSQGG